MSLASEYATIRDGIEAILAGISDVGRVHDYVRFVTSDAEVLAIAQTQVDGVNRALCWMISYANPTLDQVAFDRFEVTMPFMISGYLSLKDDAATEHLFLELAMSVAAALKNESTFGSSAVLSTGTIQLLGPDHRRFSDGGLLLHHVDIIVPVVLDQTISWT